MEESDLAKLRIVMLHKHNMKSHHSINYTEIDTADKVEKKRESGWNPTKSDDLSWVMSHSWKNCQRKIQSSTETSSGLMKTSIRLLQTDRHHLELSPPSPRGIEPGYTHYIRYHTSFVFYFLATGDSYRSLSYAYRVAVNTIHHIVSDLWSYCTSVWRKW